MSVLLGWRSAESGCLCGAIPFGQAQLIRGSEGRESDMVSSDGKQSTELNTPAQNLSDSSRRRDRDISIRYGEVSVLAIVRPVCSPVFWRGTDLPNTLLIQSGEISESGKAREYTEQVARAGRVRNGTRGWIQ